jgi:hypothetical protein
MLDESIGCTPDVRLKHREALDHELQAPLDPDERKDYEREHWGLSREAIEASEMADEYFPEAE